MFPRCFLRHASAPSHRALSTATPTNLNRFDVVQSSSKRDEKSKQSTHSALQRQELEFCCLLCGWDVACTSCPFNWFNFDPRKFRSKRRRRHVDMRQLKASKADIQQAMELLDINTTSIDKISFSQQQVKDAFRAKALEWHPDCNLDPEAETVFKEILAAYELLLAHAK